jgi:hypothetical protein
MKKTKLYDWLETERLIFSENPTLKQLCERRGLTSSEEKRALSANQTEDLPSAIKPPQPL